MLSTLAGADADPDVRATTPRPAGAICQTRRVSVVALLTCVSYAIPAEGRDTGRAAGVRNHVAVVGTVVADFAIVNDPVSTVGLHAGAPTAIRIYIVVRRSVVAGLTVVLDAVSARP